MPLRFDEQRLTDVTAEAGRVQERRNEVARRLWDMSPQNRDAPPDEAESRQHAELVTEHAFLSRRYEDLSREQEALETVRPVATPHHKQDSVVARFNSAGKEALSAEERQAHLITDLKGGSVPNGFRGHPTDLQGIESRIPKSATRVETIVVPLSDIAPPRTEMVRAAAPGIQPDESPGGEQWTPVRVYPEVGDRLVAFGGIEAACSIWMSPDGVITRIPTSDDTAAEGEIFDDVGGPTTEEEIKIGNREMRTSVGSSKKMNLSIWMEGDSPINFDGMYRTNAWRRLGRGWANQWLNGDGAGNKPRGILTDAMLGKQFAGEFGPTAEELIELQDSIDMAYIQGEGGYYGMGPPNGSGGRWCLHQHELREIRKLKGSDGHYIWLPDLSAADPATILNWPYTVDNKMPAPPAAADNAQQKVIAAGNFGEYLIRKAPMAFLARFWDSNTAGTMSYQYIAFNRCWGRFMGGFPDPNADPCEAVKYGQTAQ